MANRTIRNNFKPFLVSAFLIVTLSVLVVSVKNKTNFGSKAAGNPAWTIGEKPVNLPPQVNIILDSDMATDIDDPKALVVLNQLVRKGEVNLLAVVGSAINPTNKTYYYNTPALNAINAWYGNGNVPIGIYKGTNPGNMRESPFNQYIAQNYNYPDKNKKVKDSDYPSAVSVYRQALSTAPDNSVVILSLGFMTNLKELLNSPADNYSPMTGTQLITAKVRRLVFMGGEYPNLSQYLTPTCLWTHTGASLNYCNPEHNFKLDISSAQKVMTDWPTEMVGVSFSVGADVFTGPASNIDPSGPLAYIWSITNSGINNQQINGKRESWDSLAVLYAVRGLSAGFIFNNWGGTNTIAGTGMNTWTDTDKGKVSYLQVADKAGVIGAIESLLNTTPTKNTYCRFDTRSLYTNAAGIETDEITVGNFNYTRLGVAGWQKEDLSKVTYNINGINYRTDPNSPCYNKSSCVFDTRTRYTDYLGKLNTSITVGSNYYQWDNQLGWWNRDHDIYSVSRWKLNAHAPCYGKALGQCKFDSRSVLYLRGSDNKETVNYVETITVGPNVYIYKYANRADQYGGWVPMPNHDLASNSLYNGPFGPCNGKTSGQCVISDLMQYYDRFGKLSEFITVDNNALNYDLYYNANYSNNVDITSTKTWWNIADRQVGVISRFLENNGPCLTFP